MSALPGPLIISFYVNFRIKQPNHAEFTVCGSAAGMRVFSPPIRSDFKLTLLCQVPSCEEYSFGIKSIKNNPPKPPNKTTNK